MLTQIDLNSILLSLFSTTAIVAAVAWLARSVVTHYLNASFEQFKQRLLAESARADAEREFRYRLFLQEHASRLSALTERRATVIGELYSRLRDVLQAIDHDFSESQGRAYRSDVAPPPRTTDEQEEPHRAAKDKLSEFRMFFWKHRILFSATLCSKVETYLEALQSTYDRIDSNWYFRRTGQTIEPFVRRLDVDEWNTIVERSKPLEEALHEEFRGLLGVRDADSPKA